jgi:ubiquinone/menaquinone biosynthesis C-methylase UbiE
MVNPSAAVLPPAAAALLLLLRSTSLLSVRADISHLPFPSSSVDAVHAGAALHCWPDPAAGLAEIHRVLKPGGVLVATTCLTPTVLFRACLGENAAAVAAKVWRMLVEYLG